ncbi:hypothetical protein [Neokomagataea thailandica]|uniref:DUF2975 domain-containing protein n=1 Tax=Neokomagataea tanensis NBRC 106556 TaxID=1223519 RepID=A0ABQ0QHE5_9PROT|nr:MULTISPECIES: hypothetical protein [Neokomagataea]GBR44904.1 hypothetical protein AA106556_0584 [Neokomagataea tanensis NBRC 106556]
MYVETIAQKRIRWARWLVEVLYYWACFVGAVMCLVAGCVALLAAGVVHSIPHEVQSWQGECRKLLWDVLFCLPEVILEFYMAKTLRSFVKGLKVERIFSEDRKIIAYKYAVIWAMSVIYSFLKGIIEGFIGYKESLSSFHVSFDFDDSSDLVLFAQKIIFLLVILLLYDAGVQLQKDMDEVI